MEQCIVTIGRNARDGIYDKLSFGDDMMAVNSEAASGEYDSVMRKQWCDIFNSIDESSGTTRVKCTEEQYQWLIDFVDGNAWWFQSGVEENQGDVHMKQKVTSWKAALRWLAKH